MLKNEGKCDNMKGNMLGRGFRLLFLVHKKQKNRGDRQWTVE